MTETSRVINNTQVNFYELMNAMQYKQRIFKVSVFFGQSAMNNLYVLYTNFYKEDATQQCVDGIPVDNRLQSVEMRIGTNLACNHVCSCA